MGRHGGRPSLVSCPRNNRRVTHGRGRSPSCPPKTALQLPRIRQSQPNIFTVHPGVASNAPPALQPLPQHFPESTRAFAHFSRS